MTKTFKEDFKSSRWYWKNWSISTLDWWTEDYYSRPTIIVGTILGFLIAYLIIASRTVPSDGYISCDDRKEILKEDFEQIYYMENVKMEIITGKEIRVRLIGEGEEDQSLVFNLDRTEIIAEKYLNTWIFEWFISNIILVIFGCVIGFFFGIMVSVIINVMLTNKKRKIAKKANT